MLKESCST